MPRDAALLGFLLPETGAPNIFWVHGPSVGSATVPRDTGWAMSQENVDIVRRYYSAWNAGGIDAARAFWSDEIEWHDAPDLPDSGVYRGAESVAAHFRDLSGVLGEMEVHVDRLAPAGDEVLGPSKSRPPRCLETREAFQYRYLAVPIPHTSARSRARACVDE